MSRPAVHAQVSPPGDQELADLYNQVLIGFAEESPTSEQSSFRLPSPGEREPESAYNHFVDDGSNSRSMHSPSARPTPPAHPVIGLPASPAPPRSLPTPVTSSPTTARPVRRLPPIPGSNATLPPPPPPPLPPQAPMASPDVSFPEPSVSQKHMSGDANRRLPLRPPGDYPAQNGSNGYTNGYSSPAYPQKNLPPEPSTYANGNSSHYQTPSISFPTPDYNAASTIDWNPPRTSFGSITDVGRRSSERQYAADRTSPLGGTPEQPPLRSPSSIEDMYASPSEYRAAPQSLQPGYALQTPPSLYPGAVAGQAGVNRKPSNSSAVSSINPGIARNTSVTTTATASSVTRSSGYSDTVNFRAPSSVATTLDRGDSVGSYASRAESGDYVPPPPAKTDTAVPHQVYASQPGPSHAPVAGSSARGWQDRERDIFQQLQDIKRPLQVHEGYDDEYYDEEDPSEDGDDRFFNPALLSHIAVRLRDKVPRGTHVKGSIPYERAFTGRDIVSTIQSLIQRELLVTHNISTNDRRAALQIARSLQGQLFFYEVEWGGRILQDGVEDVYMFLDDQEGTSNAQIEREELPSSVLTWMTKCYSALCDEEHPCYSYSCPRRRGQTETTIAAPEAEAKEEKDDWVSTVPPELLETLPRSEVNRQTIIHKLIGREKQYLRDLDTVESLYIQPLRRANPPIIRATEVDDFIDEVFGNILDLRECNRRLLEVMYVRQREQGLVIHGIGDIFLDAATEFRLAYPNYMGHLPAAEKRLKDELDKNAEFRRFLEQCARHPDAHRLDLKHFLSRPSEHLQKYPPTLEAICKETTEGNPDIEFLREAIEAIKKLHTIAQLWTFQTAMNKGPSGKLEWFNLVSEDVRKAMPKKEAKRQSIIFELIKGEMDYVKDLENIEIMYVQPLREMDPPIIPRDRLAQFIQDVFHNFAELHMHHRKMLNTFQQIQRDEHPQIRSITAAIYDAVLNVREAYMEYIPNYPIAAYRIDDEVATNPPFKEFVEACTRLPDARRLDMKTFINRPIPRLLRYELLLKGILDETPEGHEDRETIPQVLELIKALGKDTEPGVWSAKQKVEVWRYNSALVFKQGEAIDLDLLNESRSLIHTGKLYRQPDGGFEWSGWTELFVLLFDNYLVMTKPKEREGSTKYQVYRRPIPLDLLTLANFTDPPTQRNTGLLRRGRGGAGGAGGTGDKSDGLSPGPSVIAGNSPDSATDSRAVYPCTIHHNGRLGGLWTLFADSAQARNEWKQKLEEAIGLRKAVQESNKVFEVETLSADTFLVPSIMPNGSTPSYSSDSTYTGKVTCSVPFNTADGRGLVAIGCAEGVWIGFRHDSRSMRRVLHLKMVTQCAMLEDFGIFLVLADRALFAYHIEALVPSSPQSPHTSQTPQKLSGNKDVHFFSVGNLNGRTLVIYMKKKGLDSVFRVLEPVIGKINERAEAPRTFGSRLGLRSQRSEWFRVYRDFFLPSESFDLIFLKARIVILCTKGFEIMDLTDFKSVTIPQRDDPRLEKLAKRCESCRPMGMFRSNHNEFLLCYDEFGLYVDRHGDPSRSVQTIEWEGTAERVACHPPYVLLFDSRFIEVRDIATGRLCQIIPGNDMRCIWDGRGTTSNPPATPGPDGWQEGVSQEPRVHGVMNSVDPAPSSGARGASRPVAQHVFELIPTIPLYLPGSLSSPSQSTYFAQSNSPPHSPRLNPTLSWRS